MKRIHPFGQRKAGLSTVAVTIRSSDSKDRGVGIVVMRNPTTLLVPCHLVTALEDDATAQVAINGAVYEHSELLSSPELEKDELALIRVRGRKRFPLACARIPSREISLHPGQQILLGGAGTTDGMLRKGKIIEVRERTDGNTLLIDVPVAPGDSGSAVVVNRELVAVCQGMIPSANGGTAIAMPLSRASLERLRNLRRESFLRRGFPALLAISAVLILSIVGALHGTIDDVSPPPDSRINSAHEEAQPNDDILAAVSSTSLFIRDWLASLADNNDQPEEDATDYAILIPTDELGDALGGMRWDSPDPTDLTCWIQSRIPENAAGIKIVASASTSMRVHLVFGANCSYSSGLYPMVSTTPQSYEFPFSSWNGQVGYNCVDPTVPKPGDWLNTIVLLPSAIAGELRVYSVSFYYQDSDADLETQ